MSARRNRTPDTANAGPILGIGSLVGVFALIAAALVQYYLVTHGVENRMQAIGLGSFSLSMPILLIPSISIVALLVASWRYLVQETLPRRTGARRPTRSETTTLGALSTAFALIAVFSVAFVLPYIIGSSLFLGLLAWVSRLFPTTEANAVSLADQLSMLARLPGLVRFSISILGASVLVVVYSMFRVWRTPRRAGSRVR